MYACMYVCMYVCMHVCMCVCVCVCVCMHVCITALGSETAKLIHCLTFTFAGTLFDSTQSYDATFYIAGSLFLSAGVISLPLHRIKRWEEQSSGQGVRDPVMPSGHV